MFISIAGYWNGDDLFGNSCTNENRFRQMSKLRNMYHGKVYTRKNKSLFFHKNG